jgi:hypothetical protein
VTILDGSDHEKNPCTFTCGRLTTAQHWIMRAAQLPGRTLHLAMTLHLLAVAKNTSRVELSNVASLQFGLDRNAKYRALACLERAGLVRVERKLGRSPLVTLLRSEGPQ